MAVDRKIAEFAKTKLQNMRITHLNLIFKFLMRFQSRRIHLAYRENLCRGS